MHTQRASTFCILKDIHRVFWIRMHIAEHPTGLVGAYGDETEVKGAAVESDLREGGAGGEVRVGSGVIVLMGRDGGGDSAVACVAIGFVVVSLCWVLGWTGGLGEFTQRNTLLHHRILHSSLPRVFYTCQMAFWR